MKKSITTAEYRVFLSVLRECRIEAGLTQVELAERIDETQSFVSKVERGEIRLDIVQLRTISRAIGVGLPKLVERFEKQLQRSPARRKRR